MQIGLKSTTYWDILTSGPYCGRNFVQLGRGEIFTCLRSWWCGEQRWRVPPPGQAGWANSPTPAKERKTKSSNKIFFYYWAKTRASSLSQAQIALNYSLTNYLVKIILLYSVVDPDSLNPDPGQKIEYKNTAEKRKFKPHEKPSDLKRDHRTLFYIFVDNFFSPVSTTQLKATSVRNFLLFLNLVKF